MSLVEFAESELNALVGEATGSTREYAEHVKADVMALIQVFAEQGHSGSSAPMVTRLFGELAMYRPIAPLTGKDDEWNDVDGKGLYQSRRAHNIFKQDGVAYQMDGYVFREPTGAQFTSQPASRRALPAFPTFQLRSIIVDCGGQWPEEAIEALRAHGLPVFGESDAPTTAAP